MNNEQWYNKTLAHLKRLLSDIEELNDDRDPTPRLARDVFTTICIVLDIEADTDKSDELLGDMYDIVYRTVPELEYYEFEEYMLADIV